MFFGIAGRLLYYVCHVLLLGPLLKVECSFNSLSWTALKGREFWPFYNANAMHIWNILIQTLSHFSLHTYTPNTGKAFHTNLSETYLSEITVYEC